MSLPVVVVIGVLLGCQWLAVGVVAAITPHNGFAYYSGGDATWNYTSAWVLEHLNVPKAVIESLDT